MGESVRLLSYLADYTNAVVSCCLFPRELDAGSNGYFPREAVIE